ncbi:MAG: hypothetical protein GYB48_06325 [Gammaproteobacteria bacterium]|nr:hypothetical protein [Gammaproteobacteria bacterium]
MSVFCLLSSVFCLLSSVQRPVAAISHRLRRLS